LATSLRQGGVKSLQGETVGFESLKTRMVTRFRDAMAKAYVLGSRFTTLFPGIKSLALEALIWFERSGLSVENTVALISFGMDMKV
jgi:DNA-binding LacI/PurR family transcriptional regulator